jgi:hypothetical protein
MVHFRTNWRGVMIAKSIIVFWTVLCFMIFMKSGATAFGAIANGVIWALVVVPTAAIGRLFKDQNKQYTLHQQRVRTAILIIAGLLPVLMLIGGPNTGDMTPAELRRENLRAEAELDRAQKDLRRAREDLWNTIKGNPKDNPQSSTESDADYAARLKREAWRAKQRQLQEEQRQRREQQRQTDLKKDF